MAYRFPPDVEHLVRLGMATGHYSSEDELLRNALNAFVAQDDDLAAIQVGLDDVKAGRVHSLEEVDAEIRQALGFSSPE